MNPNPISRLRWRCRRGTKELDFLLSWYLDQRYPAAANLNKLAFDKLLDAEDDVLWDWLMARGAAPEQAQQAIVDEIRAHHRL